MSDQQNGQDAGLARLRSGEPARLDLLRRLGEARGSTVITYITSYREGWNTMVLSSDVRMIERHAARARAEGAKRVDLFLSTWGGDATVPWALHAMLRDYLPKAKLGVILPFESYSAGTGIALGGDEIVMGLSSVLGPVDTQARKSAWQPKPVAGGVSALEGFLSMLRDFDLRGKLDDRKTLDWLTRNADPLMLGEVYRLYRENRRKIMKIMESRRQPLPKREMERIADYFLYEVGIHSQGIRRREAREAGLSYITDLETTGLEAIVGDLFAEYAAVMQLFTPFLRAGPHAMPGAGGDRDVRGEHSGETPVVLIESLYETNAAFKAYGSHRVWQPPRVPGSTEPETPDTTPAPAEAVSWSFSAHDRGTMRRR